jgi:hypothetical protein
MTPAFESLPLIGEQDSKASPNDGGPAFPIAVQRDFQFANNGMALRDYFAAHAIMAVGAYSCRFLPEIAAAEAYKIADAMLQAREA